MHRIAVLYTLLLAGCTYQTIYVHADPQPDACVNAYSQQVEQLAPTERPGTSCPFVFAPLECGDASAFQVWNGQGWVNCADAPSACPTGWPCSGPNQGGNFELHTCP
jgi:hypothetical protein